MNHMRCARVCHPKCGRELRITVRRVVVHEQCAGKNAPALPRTAVCQKPSVELATVQQDLSVDLDVGNLE
jgi:hypothetical protein